MPKTDPENTALAEADKRAALYEEFTPALKKLATYCRDIDAKVRRGNILARYDMGKKLADAAAAEDQYGVESLPKLATYLGTNVTELNDLRSFATSYKREQVEQLCEKEMANGGRITLNHLLAIMRVSRGDDRRKLWGRVFAESLSIKELAQEIGGSAGKTNKRGGGRPPATPKSLKAGISQVFSSVQQINNRFDVWDNVVFSELAAMPPDDVDGIVLKKAEEAGEQLHTLAAGINARVALFDTGLEYLRTVTANIATAAQNAAEAAAEGEGEVVGEPVEVDENPDGEDPDDDLDSDPDGDDADGKPQKGKKNKVRRRPAAV